MDHARNALTARANRWSAPLPTRAKTVLASARVAPMACASLLARPVQPRAAQAAAVLSRCVQAAASASHLVPPGRQCVERLAVLQARHVQVGHASRLLVRLAMYRAGRVVDVVIPAKFAALILLASRGVALWVRTAVRRDSALAPRVQLVAVCLRVPRVSKMCAVRPVLHAAYRDKTPAVYIRVRPARR